LKESEGTFPPTLCNEEEFEEFEGLYVFVIMTRAAESGSGKGRKRQG